MYKDGREREPKAHTARWLTGLRAILPPVVDWYRVDETHKTRCRMVDERREKLTREQREKEYAARAEAHRMENERKRIEEEVRRNLAEQTPPTNTVTRTPLATEKPATEFRGEVPVGQRLEIE